MLVRHRIQGLVAALLLAAGAAQAAGPAGLRLRPQPDLAPGSASLPRIAAPATPATRRINNALARLDADWVRLIGECRSDGYAGPDHVNRSITVDRAGPDFLSVEVQAGVDCGGAHGDNWFEPLTYDLKTGAPVNWLRLLPGYRLSAQEGNFINLRTSYFTSPSLRRAYYQWIKADAARNGDTEWAERCGDVLDDDDIAFFATFDRERKTLDIWPATLAHVVYACGDPMLLTPADLRAVGADPRLIAAVEMR